MEQVGVQSLARFVRALCAEKTVAIAGSGLSEQQLTDLGVTVRDGTALWPDSCEPLSAEAVHQALDGRQVALKVLPAVGSTNTWLREFAESGSVADLAVTAECQVAGKGRLGRSWSTPIGGSIALSLGLRVRRSAAQLGGLSLVVGLALVDALDPSGAFGLELKWPNDIQVRGRKLGGILVEIIRTDRQACDLVVGMGLNYRLPAAVVSSIDKEVIDLHSLGQRASRNLLIAEMIDRVYAFGAEFENTGFVRFRDAFSAVHCYQGRSARVLGPSSSIDGVVQGVDDEGRLLLATEAGIQPFSAGEVSLREH